MPLQKPIPSINHHIWKCNVWYFHLNFQVPPVFPGEFAPIFCKIFHLCSHGQHALPIFVKLNERIFFAAPAVETLYKILVIFIGFLPLLFIKDILLALPSHFLAESIVGV